ncbi:MAG: protein phosphatase 2C domain-containing protein [Acidobacteriota bacterium]|nr:protein phosphatase 2C domain-containing protein [Acidobacteriota bacterium]
MTIAHAACSDPGLVRPANEDSYRAIPEIGLYLLADGMGGARGGGRASRLAVDTVAEQMLRVARPDASSLLAAVEQAHGQVRKEASENPALNGMGSTLVAALVQGSEVVVVSVGDSRAYRFSGSALKLLTEDQTWVVDVGIPLGLSPDALKRHPNRHALTMAIGIDADLITPYYMTTLEPGCGILLTSDGLHGLVPNEIMARVMADRGAPLQQRCEQLIEAARKAGGPDNITAVVLEAVS